MPRKVKSTVLWSSDPDEAQALPRRSGQGPNAAGPAGPGGNGNGLGGNPNGAHRYPQGNGYFGPNGGGNPHHNLQNRNPYPGAGLGGRGGPIMGPNPYAMNGYPARANAYYGGGGPGGGAYGSGGGFGGPNNHGGNTRGHANPGMPPGNRHPGAGTILDRIPASQIHAVSPQRAEQVRRAWDNMAPAGGNRDREAGRTDGRPQAQVFEIKAKKGKWMRLI